MAKVKQRIPNFVETSMPPKQYEFQTIEELLNIDWIQKYTKWENFARFCRNKYSDLLMIENEDGTWWWVVAYVDKGSIDELPVVQMNKLLCRPDGGRDGSGYNM